MDKDLESHARLQRHLRRRPGVTGGLIALRFCGSPSRPGGHRRDVHTDPACGHTECDAKTRRRMSQRRTRRPFENESARPCNRRSGWGRKLFRRLTNQLGLTPEQKQKSPPPSN